MRWTPQELEKQKLKLKMRIAQEQVKQRPSRTARKTLEAARKDFESKQLTLNLP